MPAPDSSTLLDKRGTTIRDMFAGVAPRYDLLNHVLSGSLDLVWRRRAARALDAAPGTRLLDLCCGTGDQALALARRGGRVVAGDFCVPMLALAEPKYDRFASRNGATRPRGLAADALGLPFASALFGGATVAFGLRNVADLDRALGEIHRTLKPGAPLVVLEFAVPRLQPLKGLYLLYFRRLLPAIGRLLSHRGSAYSYLPNSVLEFPQRQGFLDRMAAAGFTDLESHDLAAGAVCLYRGRRRA